MTITNVPPTTATAASMEADKFTASFVWVSPDVAERWLARNEKNRNPAPRTVDRYRRDMLAGDWIFTGETVKFAADGRLLDGQHRLRAIVASDVTILILVVRGLDPKAQDVMDTNRRRSAADMLTMHEKANAVLLASVSKLVVSYQKGAIKTSDSQFLGEVSHSEILHITNSDPFVSWAASIARACKDIPANPAAIGFAAWLTGRSDPTTTIDFLNAVAEMRTDGAGDPRFTLLRRLQVAKDQRERLTSVQQAFLITRAWQAHRDGLPLKTIKMATSSGPIKFPTFQPPVSVA